MRFFLLLVLFFTPLAAIGDPSVTITPTVKKAGRQVLMTLEQADLDSMTELDCHYNIFAADRRSDLTTLPGKGLSVATFFRNQSPLSIIAVQLKRLSYKKLGRRYVRVYLRVLMPCAYSESSMSEIFSFRVRTSVRGKVPNVDRLIKRMKNHMRYATDQEIEHWSNFSDF